MTCNQSCNISYLLFLVVMNARYIFLDPCQVLMNGRVACIILAVLHHITGNSVHSPPAIVVLTHHWTATITPACIGFLNFPESHADGLPLMSAISFFNNGHACLLKEMGRVSRVNRASPT